MAVHKRQQCIGGQPRMQEGTSVQGACSRSARLQRHRLPTESDRDVQRRHVLAEHRLPLAVVVLDVHLEAVPLENPADVWEQVPSRMALT